MELSLELVFSLSPLIRYCFKFGLKSVHLLLSSDLGLFVVFSFTCEQLFSFFNPSECLRFTLSLLTKSGLQLLLCFVKFFLVRSFHIV